ncbi:MAG TPA: DUF5719 family protein [Chloroflexota bacterium]|nr:DUF5719 family protein [Chloroflexota bacterium]
MRPSRRLGRAPDTGVSTVAQGAAGAGRGLFLALLLVVGGLPACWPGLLAAPTVLVVRQAAGAAPLPARPFGPTVPVWVAPPVGPLPVQRAWVPAQAVAYYQARLAALPGVRGVEPLARVQAAGIPNDPYFADYQWNLRQIHAPEAWDLTTGDRRLIVAVVDTGVALDHPDLAGQLLPGQNFVQPGAPPADDNGHGTHVAGIIGAATNNGVGVAGLLWQVQLLPVKVLDASGGGDADRVAQGIAWAADQGARVINLSFVGANSAGVLADAVQYARSKGALVVAAVGNDGQPDPTYPAALDGVLAVTATTRTDDRLPSANWGDYVSVAAPGEQIASTYWDPAVGNTYAAASSSSQAAPQVAGLAGLVWAANPALSADTVRALIEAHADRPAPPARADQLGAGRINAYRTVLAALPWLYDSRGAAAYRAPAEAAARLFLPYVVKGRDGWTSTLLLRNATAQPATLTVAFYGPDGLPVATVPLTLNAYAVAPLPLHTVAELPTGFAGTAVVDTAARLTAWVQQDRPGAERHGYLAAAPAPRLYAPLVQRGPASSTVLYLQNASESRIQVTARYFDPTGAPVAQQTVTLAPRASTSLRLAEAAGLSASFLGSAVVEADAGLLAGAAVRLGDPAPSAYALQAESVATLAAPLVFKAASGWSSRLHVLNTGSAPTLVTVAYWREPGAPPVTESTTLAPWASATFALDSTGVLSDGYVGAATITSNGGALVALVQHTRAGGGEQMSYPAAAASATTLDIPFLARDFGGWTAGLRVQNLVAEPAELRVTYYDQGGRVAWQTQDQLPPLASATYLLDTLAELPGGYLGSATISSNGRPLAASVNWVKRGP